MNFSANAGLSLRQLGRTALLLLGASACSVVLDIEQAHVDESLERGADAATSGVSNDNKAGSASRGGASSAEAGSAPSENEGGKGDDASVGGAGGAPVEMRTPCEEYCDLVTNSCTGDLEQYRSRGQCLEVCARMPPGEPGDEQGNTLACRLRQARFAESEPPYCKTAGPLGGDKCGSNCESYCALMQASCTPESTEGNLEPSYFLDMRACLQNCDSITPGPGAPTVYSSSATAKPSAYVGNSIFCRMYHLAAGLEQAAEDEHCPHAMGGEPCTDEE